MFPAASMCKLQQAAYGRRQKLSICKQGVAQARGCGDNDVIIITAYSLFCSQLSCLWNLNSSLKLTVKQSWCDAATKWMIVSASCFLNKECKRSNFWSIVLLLHLLCLVVAPSQTPFSKPVLQVYL